MKGLVWQKGDRVCMGKEGGGREREGEGKGREGREEGGGREGG